LRQGSVGFFSDSALASEHGRHYNYHHRKHRYTEQFDNDGIVAGLVIQHVPGTRNLRHIVNGSTQKQAC